MRYFAILLVIMLLGCGGGGEDSDKPKSKSYLAISTASDGLMSIYYPVSSSNNLTINNDLSGVWDLSPSSHLNLSFSSLSDGSLLATRITGAHTYEEYKFSSNRATFSVTAWDNSSGINSISGVAYFNVSAVGGAG